MRIVVVILVMGPLWADASSTTTLSSSPMEYDFVFNFQERRTGFLAITYDYHRMHCSFIYYFVSSLVPYTLITMIKPTLTYLNLKTKTKQTHNLGRMGLIFWLETERMGFWVSGTSYTEYDGCGFVGNETGMIITFKTHNPSCWRTSFRRYTTRQDNSTRS